MSTLAHGAFSFEASESGPQRGQTRRSVVVGLPLLGLATSPLQPASRRGLGNPIDRGACVVGAYVVRSRRNLGHNHPLHGSLCTP